MKSFTTLIFVAACLWLFPIVGVDAVSSLGEGCQVRYGLVGSDGDFKYFETGNGNIKCDSSNGANLVCIPEADDGSANDLPGFCEETRCFQPMNATEGKVTVCHRTCSETNPWVRITIDSNAWADASCKHGQHTTDKCTGKNLTKWGPNQADFILKYHGTKDQVSEQFGGITSTISSYWKHWEPACPSVRNGACCAFSGTYGYSCCGRAGIDPVIPPPTPQPTRAPTRAPTPQPTSAPVTPAPTLPPTPSPTPAPVTTPTTPEPTPQPTPAPVLAPTLQPTPPPIRNCRRQRHLREETAAAMEVADSAIHMAMNSDGHSAQVPTPRAEDRSLQAEQTLEQKWNISEPTFFFDALSFTLDFQISDYIAQDDMVHYTMYEQDCETLYTGNGLSGVKGSRVAVANEPFQEVGITVNIDSAVVSQDTQVYSEPAELIDNQVTANIDFCMRFALHTPVEVGDEEVNYLEVIVRLDVDLTDGFQIGAINVEALDPCERAADIAYEVEGYFCAQGNEPVVFAETLTMSQGQIVTVCVRPLQNALDDVIRMRDIQEFTWFLSGSSVQQPAIENYAPSANGLTQKWCSRGYAICVFETILFATFFDSPGVVTGSGTADMQFGGEDSQTSVSPRISRRQRALLEQEDAELATTSTTTTTTLDIQRILQDDPPAASAVFEMRGFTTPGQSSRNNSGAAAPGVSHQIFSNVLLLGAVFVSTTMVLLGL